MSQAGLINVKSKYNYYLNPDSLLTLLKSLRLSTCSAIWNSSFSRFKSEIADNADSNSITSVNRYNM